MNWSNVDSDQLGEAMSRAGVVALYAKVLAPNDNSKNQIYLGGSLAAAQLLPFSKPFPEVTKKGRRTLKAKLNFYWLEHSGRCQQAPDAQLILYPQYPEVRLGSILRSADIAPSELIASREEGRVLILGVTNDRRIVAVCVARDSPIAAFVRRLSSDNSLLFEVPLRLGQSVASRREKVLEMLRGVHADGWLPSISLRSDGTRTPCASGNCVGYTLEAALGIPKNGRPGPDLYGWEIKGAEVKRPEYPPPSKPFTLMTPEPSGGIYCEQSPADFIARFGYPDVAGRQDRLNFGGVHRVGEINARTGLTLTLEGALSGGRFDPFGKLSLVDQSGNEAASWSFAKLAELWNRKHSQAAYMFAQKKVKPDRSYRFGPRADIAVGTRLDLLLQALACGAVYYDPGLKLENASSDKQKVKRRSQFRIKYKDLGKLYDSYHVELLN
ncbi:MvaI/BcnI family restriction endonuclease [Hyphomonas jannaschiana]|uniref:MvaI/BcnI family restriction endonuclease n=1 Tax=Hyphomonas jannaschiana TaxID=86 RepID=UPI0035C76ED0